MARKSNQEFFCWEDNEKVRTEDIQDLTKDLEAYKIMKDEYKMKARSQKDQFFNNTMSSAWSAGNLPAAKEAPASPLLPNNKNIPLSEQSQKEKEPIADSNGPDIRHMISTIHEVDGEESKNESMILAAATDPRKPRKKKTFLETESSENDGLSAQRAHNHQDTERPEESHNFDQIVEAEEEEDAKEPSTYKLKTDTFGKNVNDFVLPQTISQQNNEEETIEFNPKQSFTKSEISQEENQKIAREMAEYYVTRQILINKENQKPKDYLYLEKQEIKENSIEEETMSPEFKQKVPSTKIEKSNEKSPKIQSPLPIQEEPVIPTLNYEIYENNPKFPQVVEEKKLSQLSLESSESPYEKKVTEYKHLDKQTNEPNEAMELHSVILKIPQSDRSEKKPMVIREDVTPSASFDLQSSNAVNSNEGISEQPVEINDEKTQSLENKSSQEIQRQEFKEPETFQEVKVDVMKEEQKDPSQNRDIVQIQPNSNSVLSFGLNRTATQILKEENEMEKSVIGKKKKKKGKKKKKTPDHSMIIRKDNNLDENPSPTISEQPSASPLQPPSRNNDDQLNTSQSLKNQEIENKDLIYMGKAQSFGGVSKESSGLAMRKMVTKKSVIQLDSDTEEGKEQSKQEIETEEEKLAGYDHGEQSSPDQLRKALLSTQQYETYSANKGMNMQLNQQFQQPESRSKVYTQPIQTKVDYFKLPEINRNIHQKPTQRPPAPPMQQRRMITSPLSLGRSSSEEIKRERSNDVRMSKESVGSRYINSKRNSPLNENHFAFDQFNATEPRATSTRSIQSVVQDARVAQVLTEQCRLHPIESVKYFCRNEKCQKALCPDCVLEHARHDFIAANELAALEVKGAVKTALRTCRDRAKNIKNIKLDTHKKLSDLHRQRADEFQKIHCYFLELHRELDDREQTLKQIYNDKIKDVEARLMQDSQAIEQEYTKQSTTFKKFKSLQDQFQISSEAGIVGAAEIVYHQTRKLAQIAESLPYFVVEEAGRDLPNPNVVLNLDMEKEKIMKIGLVQGVNLIGENDEDPTNQTLTQQMLTEETKQDDLTKSKSNFIQLSPKRQLSQHTQTDQVFQDKQVSKVNNEMSNAKLNDPQNAHWFRWGTTSVLRFDPAKKEWLSKPGVKVDSKFLFFSSVCHLPQEKGCFLMGGSDNEDNYSKRTQYFCKYNVFVEKPHMISKRAFFPSIYCRLDNSIFVVGGNDSNRDLDKCEKFSLTENTWRQTASLNTARNGSALVIFEQYRLMFCFGGNNHKLGSLNRIERYDMDFDKWTTIAMTLKTGIHDLGLIQLANERVLIYGGHTNQEPSKQLHLLDMSVECLKSKSGLIKLKKGGKCYFNPVQSEGSKVLLIFGYLDEKPEFEEIDLQEVGPISEASMIMSSKQSQRSNK